MKRGAHGDCSRFGRSDVEEKIKRSAKVREVLLVINSQHDHLTLTRQCFVCLFVFEIYVFPFKTPQRKLGKSSPRVQEDEDRVINGAREARWL